MGGEIKRIYRCMLYKTHTHTHTKGKYGILNLKMEDKRKMKEKKEREREEGREGRGGGGGGGETKLKTGGKWPPKNNRWSRASLLFLKTTEKNHLIHMATAQWTRTI